MKAPRLTRSKTSNETVAASTKPKDTRSSTGLTFKTSFDDLRSPDGRQKLREQLSSQFPESYASSLKSSPSATDMAGGDWLNVGQNAAAKSSSSSVESTGNLPNRLSSVPEKNAAIDVEQAIHLLTELKKTATPEQLVALHKALLPTRDSIVSTVDSPVGQRTSLIRQKSLLPAGLATRGGASEDLLKRQEDVEPVIRKKKSGRSDGHRRLQSKSSIAALDLADDATNPLPAQRAETPSDGHYFGAYRPGTLRITNGAASPEPSMRPKTSGDGATTTISSEQIASSRNRTVSLAKAVSEQRHQVGSAPSSPRRHTASAAPGLPANIPQSRSRDPSQSRQYRSKRSQEPLQSSTPLARSQEPSLSRQPPQVETKQSKQNLAASRKASVDTLLRRSIDSISVRKSIDDGRVSPIDAPRFAQRWSHRASQISQEYANDCDVPVSPFEDKQTALAFAQRLSTVYDGEDAEATANETPEAALSKLEGSTAEVIKLSEERSRRRSEASSEERRSLRATADVLNNTSRPPLVSHQTDPRPMPSKADSGYVSDASHRSMQQYPSRDSVAKYSESPVTMEHTQPGYKEIVHRVDPDAEDIQSLYTLEQILKMPSLFSGPSTPSRPDAARKHSSLLKLTGLKKSSLAASRTTLDPHSSADSLPLANEVGGSSPAEPALKSVKSTKKLQKRMPEDVRKQRKSQRDKERQSSLTLAGQGRDLDGADTQKDLSELASSPAPVSELANASTTMLASSPLAARKEITPAEALSELVGDSQQPAELETDESTAPRESLSRKQSRKSRRRSRRQSAGPTTDTEGESNSRRSFSLGRKRSKSKRRSGSLTPKRKSQDAPAVPPIVALLAQWTDNDNDSQESLPLYSDYGSVSRTLGTNPYDISTDMFKRSTTSPGPVLDQLQSPHQISTSFSRTKSGGLKGMDSTMASELARLKSRDVAIQNNEDVYDRPRMATPNRRSQTDLLQFGKTMPNALMVKQRSPGWTQKPVFQQRVFVSVESEARQRPHSIAESIPSLPELPVDAEARAAKASEYLAKRERELRASPILAESPSPTASSDLNSSDQPGFSNESVAEAVARAVEARRAKHAERVKQGQKADRLRPAGPRMNSDTSSSSGNVSLQLHGVDERPYSDASASILIGVGSDRDDHEERPSTAPVQNNDDAEVSVWQRQAQMWRQRRDSTGKTLGKPVEEDTIAEPEQSDASPAIVVSRHSALEDLPSARRRRKSASEHANAYRDLIGSESESFDDVQDPNRGSVQSTSTVTDNRSSTSTVVVEQALPAKAYQATLIHRSRSPGGRVHTPSGSYHPYTPDHAAQAERSRAGSLAQLEGRKPRATQSLDIPQRPHHQQNDTLESIVGRYDRTLSPVPASEAGSIHESPEPPAKSPRRAPMVDRYGGGFQYGYEKGVGVKGSSGLRSSMTASSPRGGSRFSQNYGLDLGDVPVFLRRAA